MQSGLVDSRGDPPLMWDAWVYIWTLLSGKASGNTSRPGQLLVRHTYGHDDMDASRGPGRLGA